VKLPVGWKRLDEVTATYTMASAESKSSAGAMVVVRKPEDHDSDRYGRYEIRVFSVASNSRSEDDAVHRRNPEEAMAHAELLVAQKVLAMRRTGLWTGRAELNGCEEVDGPDAA